VPADANQIDRVIRHIATNGGNFVVALGRSTLPVLCEEGGTTTVYGSERGFTYGEAEWLREGTDGCILASGGTVWRAVKISETLAVKGIRIGVLNISCPLAIPVGEIRKAAETGLILTYEDHNKDTGMGAAVAVIIAEQGLSCSFKRFGIGDYGLSSDPEYQYAARGMSHEDVMNEIIAQVSRRRQG
jgi:transketolase